MRPSMDLRRAVRAFTVTNRNIADLEVQLSRAKQKVEIAERIEITKYVAVLRHPKIIPAEERFRTAQRILDGLSQYPRERDTEEFIGAHVQEAHGLLVHRIDQTTAIRKLGMSRNQGGVKLRQLFGRHRQVGIEDHQDLTCGRSEAFANGVALSYAGRL